MKFKVGDRVVTNVDLYRTLPVGSKGFIRSINANGVGVQFPGFRDGHSLSGDLEGSSEGWYVSRLEIRKDEFNIYENVIL